MKILVGYREVEDKFWAWIAGFWEGEGNVSIWTNKKGQRKVWLGIGQKDPSPLFHIRDTTGIGSVFKQIRKKDHLGGKYIWRYALANRRDLLWFLESMKPHLRFRKKKVNDAIALLQELDSEARWHPWSARELEYLRENFHSGSHAELTVSLQRGWPSIKEKAQKMGLRRR